MSDIFSPATFRGMKSVYSFVFPEVRRTITDFDAAFSPTLMRVNTPASALGEFVNGHVSPDLVIPATSTGFADLDALHAPIMDIVAARVAPYAPGLLDFPNRYPTAGSSEGLFHLLVNLSNRRIRRIRVLAGEYEGFGIQAANVGMICETYRLGRKGDPNSAWAVKPADDACWFMSSPSARDGNLLPDDIVSHLSNAGHKIVLDLAYLGSTAPTLIDVSHPNIIAVAMSLSKPYGLFRWRIGYLFSRSPIDSLYGSRWFFDAARHLLGVKVLSEIGPTLLQPRYASAQHAITDSLAASGIPLRPSDALILAAMPIKDLAGCSAGVVALLTPFVRADSVRVCLTPYFEATADLAR